MDIKKTANLLINFTIRRLAEIFGIILFVTGILLLLALLTYSPEDPNFIFPDNTEIRNILGFHGSFISDLFFQSIGLISYLISLTLIITGVNIFIKKEFFLIIENIFYAIVYSVFGTLFLSHFYSNAFTLYINGNGGFLGNYFNQTFLNSLILINSEIFYYILIFLILIFFLISINFNPVKFYENFKKLLRIFSKSKEKNYTHKSEVISEYIPQEEIKNLIQEDLPFIKAENKNDTKIKFKLPNINLLKEPTKLERENSNKNDAFKPEFLEKILLDFGVDGKIKKVSNGPVVTLNEFEPAAGVNPVLLEEIIERIREINRMGITILIIEHNMEMVMKLCSPIMVMSEGSILMQGDADEIRSDKRLLEAFFGE